MVHLPYFSQLASPSAFFYLIFKLNFHLLHSTNRLRLLFIKTSHRFVILNYFACNERYENRIKSVPSHKPICTTLFIIWFKIDKQPSPKKSKQILDLWNNQNVLQDKAGNTKGGSFTVPLTSCLTGLEQLYDNWQFLFLFTRLIQTSQTGGQWYSDTSPFSIPWIKILFHPKIQIFCLKRGFELQRNKADSREF